MKPRQRFPQLIKSVEAELHRVLVKPVNITQWARPWIVIFDNIAQDYPHLVKYSVHNCRVVSADNIDDSNNIAGYVLTNPEYPAIVVDRSTWITYNNKQKQLVISHELFHYATQTLKHRKKSGCLMSDSVGESLKDPNVTVEQLIKAEFRYLNAGGKYLRR